jgi:D-beta-D-heptose 7-phosphate kinase/D-beta-D-heptose 1-phosphate adenosyltransferase
MRGRRVAVVGDIMVDEWIWGTVNRISPEAPVPVVGVSNHSYTLGGAGNVAKNLEALGASVALLSAIGDDHFGQMARSFLTEDSSIDDHLITVNDRPTTRKTRVVAHNQQVVRVDWESPKPLESQDAERFVQRLRHLAATADAVIFSDYAKGVLSRELVQAAEECPVLLADPKPGNAQMFRNVTCIAPNALEATKASGITICDERSLSQAGEALVSALNCRYVVITRGEHGMSLFGQRGERFDMPSVARSVYDVSGAGDTVIATLALALAAGIRIEEAMRIATYAAGIVVEKLGTASVLPEEIVSMAESLESGNDAIAQGFHKVGAGV